MAKGHLFTIMTIKREITKFFQKFKIGYTRRKTLNITTNHRHRLPPSMPFSTDLVVNEMHEGYIGIFGSDSTTVAAPNGAVVVSNQLSIKFEVER